MPTDKEFDFMDRSMGLEKPKKKLKKKDKRLKLRHAKKIVKGYKKTRKDIMNELFGD